MNNKKFTTNYNVGDIVYLSPPDFEAKYLGTVNVSGHNDLYCFTFLNPAEEHCFKTFDDEICIKYNLPLGTIPFIAKPDAMLAKSIPTENTTIFCALRVSGYVDPILVFD